jgi:2-methylcitrate dehydratase PrpD
MGTGSISERIARYAIESVVEETQSELHAEQQSVLTLSLMDWIAVGRAGVDEPVSGVVRSVCCAQGGREQAGVFGSSQRLPARLAAQVNGATSHALDYDDTHFLHVGHTSVVVFSAAFALGESQSVKSVVM